MDKSCVFCKIAAGEIPSQKLYEDDTFFCIQDIRPHAKKHLLVIPKKHVSDLETAFAGEPGTGVTLLGGLFEVAVKVAREQELLPGGFRSVINTGRDGGQTVFHLHLHLLGGEPLRENLG